MKNIEFIFKTLDSLISFEPLVNKLAKQKASDFEILIATMMSARTKDELTEKVAKQLFSVANTPSKILKLEQKDLEDLIYPVGFYRTKAKNILKISQILLSRFNGKIPNNIDELQSLPGVGLKTAALVLSEGFAMDEICVDTHVHRISNRLGLIKTKTTTESYNELKKQLPKKYWRLINYYFVSYGKTICKPIGPRCKDCKLEKVCPKKGVKKRVSK